MVDSTPMDRLANVGAYQPGDTSISWDAPWMELFDDTFGWIMGSVLFILAILAVIGLAMWVAGKLGAGGRSQNSGLTMAGVSVLAAVGVAVTGSVIMWATDLGPNWFNASASVVEGGLSLAFFAV